MGEREYDLVSNFSVQIPEATVMWVSVPYTLSNIERTHRGGTWGLARTIKSII